MDRYRDRHRQIDRQTQREHGGGRERENYIKFLLCLERNRRYK